MDPGLRRNDEGGGSRPDDGVGGFRPNNGPPVSPAKAGTKTDNPPSQRMEKSPGTAL